MKLYEILTEDEFDRGANFSNDQLEMAYDAVDNLQSPIYVEELKDLAQEFTEDARFGRSPGSALFLLVRMCVLVNAEVPHGISERSAEQLFMPSRRMERWVQGIGHNVQQNIQHARQNLANRPRPRTREEAKAEMWNYYKDHRQEIAPSVKRNTDAIIHDLMQGNSPEAAFQDFIR